MQIGEGVFHDDMLHVWFFRPYDMISYDVLVSTPPFVMLASVN